MSTDVVCAVCGKPATGIFTMYRFAGGVVESKPYDIVPICDDPECAKALLDTVPLPEPIGGHYIV